MVSAVIMQKFQLFPTVLMLGGWKMVSLLLLITKIGKNSGK